jgi:hypothetical protein
MPNDPAYIREFKKFTQGRPSVTDLGLLEAELYGASDRASTVMYASFTESALEALLRSKVRPAYSADDMRRLFEFSGILGSFGAKITAAYAFNWFGPETRNDLDLIRLLRNEFAHSRKSFGFTDPPVAAVCAHLKSPDWPGSRIPLGPLTRENVERHETDKTHPRTRFRSACHTISLGLLDHAGEGIGSYTDLR